MKIGETWVCIKPFRWSFGGDNFEVYLGDRIKIVELSYYELVKVLKIDSEVKFSIFRTIFFECFEKEY